MPQRAKHTQQQQQQNSSGTTATFAVHGHAAASPTSAAAAAFDAEVQRQRTDSQHELAAQSLNGSHGAGVLGFMRRARISSSSSSNTAGDGEASGLRGDESLPSAPLRMDRRGSVEAEVPSHSDDDDDDEQEDPLHTKSIAIARAQSPENAHGAELECALLNQAAAAAAAAADSTNATATSVPASASNAGSLVHPHGGISVGDFELLKVVGRGAYGKVFLCRKHSSGRLYAMKVVAKSEAIRKNVVANMKVSSSASAYECEWARWRRIRTRHARNAAAHSSGGGDVRGGLTLSLLCVYVTVLCCAVLCSRPSATFSRPFATHSS